MTSTVPETTKSSTSEAGTARRSTFGRFRRPWALAAVAAAVAAALGLVIWGQLAQQGDRTPLSINNSGPDGARAVGQILGRQGVDIEDTATFEDAMDALAAGDSPTLLLYDPDGFLDDSRLRELSAAAERLVVVTPRLQTLDALGTGISQAGVVPEASPVLEPGCSLADAEAAGPVSGESGFVYDGGTSCYRPAASPAGLLAVSRDGHVMVLGSTAILSNQRLDELGNAALGIRTLGSSGDLVWYLPSVADLDTSGYPKTLNELAPAWARFIGLWLALVALAAIAWRGRRHGPLVFEPLPVVVKAAETAEGRARLYHDSHAVEQARDTLRAGALVRLARKLRLGPGATADDTAEAAARFLDRPPSEIKQLLDERPATETRLVAWLQELDALEKEVNS